MSLTDKINADIKTAMLSREKEKLEALRAIKAALLLEATKGSAEITSDAEIKMLQKMYKQRTEAAEIYNQQNRADLEKAELFQAAIIKNYLPAQMSEEEIKKIIADAKITTGASSPADMGKLMAAVMPKIQGKADGKLVSDLVKNSLS